MYLFFDTETTGLPKNYKAPLTDLNNWPRLVQIAWIMHDNNGRTLARESFIIKPNGFNIPNDVLKIHGITTEHAHKNGVEITAALSSFCEHINASKYLIAHNIDYDKNIVGSELIRNKMPNIIPTKKLLCTMSSSTNYCAIKSSNGYKWPRLTELHQKLFNCGFEGAHDALADITATAKCFWELRRRNLI